MSGPASGPGSETAVRRFTGLGSGTGRDVQGEVMDWWLADNHRQRGHLLLTWRLLELLVLLAELLVLAWCLELLV